MKKLFALFLTMLLSACAPAATPTPTATLQVVSLYATSAAQPWVPEVYACADKVSVVIRLSASESAAEIRLRLGEPENLSTPAYQIGSDDLLVITSRESAVQNLTAEQARALFSQRQENVQVWAFADGEDAQQIFKREVMRGAGVTSQARLAVSPQQMSDEINAANNAVGLLPRRWKAGNGREVFRLPDIPVLALTRAEPQGSMRALLACLQNNHP